MSIILLYHRIGTKGALSVKKFETHLTFIKSSKVLITLTFDDATFDFYHTVFPLLKKHKLKAILAVCPYFVLDRTTLKDEERLCFHEEELFNPKSKDKGFYCTYDELKEMISSNLVTIANHSFSHQNLTLPQIDLEKEVVLAKQLLEEKLSIKIDTFVYPYGKFNHNVKSFVNKSHSYQMRIGSGINFFSKRLLYRIPCDKISSLSDVFTIRSYCVLLLKTLINVLRRR